MTEVRGKLLRYARWIYLAIGWLLSVFMFFMTFVAWYKNNNIPACCFFCTGILLMPIVSGLRFRGMSILALPFSVRLVMIVMLLRDAAIFIH